MVSSRNLFKGRETKIGRKMKIIDQQSPVLSTQRYFLFFLLISLCMSIICFSTQLMLNLNYCIFCYLQRTIYLSVSGFSILGLLSPFKSLARIFITTILIVGSLIACYHVSIQYGLIADPCKIGTQVTDLHSFESLLFNSSVSCSKIPWKLFGISITVYNSVLLFLLSIVSIFSCIKSQRKLIFGKLKFF